MLNPRRLPTPAGSLAAAETANGCLRKVLGAYAASRIAVVPPEDSPDAGDGNVAPEVVADGNGGINVRRCRITPRSDKTENR